jgi:hypothetical protein
VIHRVRNRNKVNELKKAALTGTRRAKASPVPAIGCQAEQSAAKSKYPAEVNVEVAPRDPSTSLGMKEEDHAHSSDRVAFNLESSHAHLRILPLFL